MVSDHSELKSSPGGDSGLLTESVKAGRLEGLRALRDTLAREIAAGGGERSQTAALARQLRDTLKDIETLEKLVPEGSVVDDLGSRRRSRIAGTSDPTGTEGGVVE